VTSWQAFQDAGRAWALLATGLSLAVWENEPRPRTPEAFVVLSWVSAVRPGVDELVYDFDPDTLDPLAEMVPTVRGPRVYVLQLAVESYSQAASANGRQYLERASVRVRWPRAVATLAAENAALASLGPARGADYPADQRMVSRWLCEARINATAAETDSAGAIGRIATVAVSSDVDDVDGTELPRPPLNFEDEVMP
jgi:hypothetical protein